MGMVAAYYKRNKAVMFALDNLEASLIKNDAGQNLAMIAAVNGLEDCVIKGLENKEIRQQKDRNYYKLQNYCKLYNLDKAFDIACKYSLLDEKEEKERLENKINGCIENIEVINDVEDVNEDVMVQ